MTHLRGTASFVLALALGAVLSLGAVPVRAATLANLLVTDGLGYECLPEMALEAAFAASGKKGVLLPQTCLPRPCDRQISTEALAVLMGRPPRGGEWDDYVARYAELCVAETRGAWSDLDGAITDIETVAFWRPFLPVGGAIGLFPPPVVATAPPVAPLDVVPGVVIPTPAFVPVGILPLPIPSIFGKHRHRDRETAEERPKRSKEKGPRREPSDRPVDRPGEPKVDRPVIPEPFPPVPPTPQPVPVPVPATIWLLLVTLGGWWMARRTG